MVKLRKYFKKIMHPILRSLVYLALILFTVFVAIKPYNWVCRLSNKCSEIVLENLIPNIEGDQEIKVILEVINKREDIEFEVNEPKNLDTVSGRKNVVNYTVKNLTQNEVKFRPKFSIEPAEAQDFISRQECLCFKEYKLAKGETIVIPTRFKFKSKIDQEIAAKNLDSTIKISYSAEK